MWARHCVEIGRLFLLASQTKILVLWQIENIHCVRLVRNEKTIFGAVYLEILAPMLIKYLDRCDSDFCILVKLEGFVLLLA